jgi:hypothetical protein
VRTKSLCICVAVGSLVSAASGAVAPAQAQQLADAFTFKNVTYAQGGLDGSVISSTGAFFNAGVDLQNPGDFDGVTLTYPGSGGPQALPQTGPKSFGIGPSFASQAAMDAAYPFGDYVLTASNSTTMATDTETLHYTADAYAGNVPALTASSYDALQGVKTSLGMLTLDFNAQDASPLATSTFNFFTIFNSPINCGFLSPATTSCTIDPQELKPGHTYTYELDFSNRIESSPNGVLDGVNFDVRTDGTFTTAVPEPGVWALMLLGFGGLGAAMRARRGALA